MKKNALNRVCFHTSRVWFCLMCLFVLNSNFAFSQNNKISGTVTDSNGEALIGVNVIVKGTDNGTITDINGSYNIDVPSNATLVFKYIGYVDKLVDAKQGAIALNSLSFILKKNIRC